MPRRRPGTRPFICSVVPCRPGGCGAEAGQPCVAYRASRFSDPPSGRPVAEVHAVRWRNYRAWLAEQRNRIQ